MDSVQYNNHIYCNVQSSETLFDMNWLFSLVFKLFFIPRVVVDNIVIINIFGTVPSACVYVLFRWRDFD